MDSPDAFWTAGKTFTDAENNISIKIDELDGNRAIVTIGPTGG